MLDKNFLVEKKNLLTEMRAYSMTLQELRFLSIYISRINPYDINSRYVEFTLDEFKAIMEMGRINKKHLQDVFARLLTKIVEIPLENEKGKYVGFEMVQLFSKCKCKFDDELQEWRITINAHDDILPLLFDLQNNFLKYQLWNCLRLKSTNQIRMYEILKQYETRKTRTLSIADLKYLLGIQASEYPVYSIFRRDVIEVCKKALKENTDIYFEYEPIKKGRKFVEIKFFIYKNKDHQDPLHIKEFISDTNENIIEIDFDAITTETKQDPKSDMIVFLQGAVENEFSETEMNLIFNKICLFNFSNRENIEIARYHYLAEKYAMLNVQNEKRKIHDRFKYFLTMLTEPEQIQPEMKY